MRKHNLGRGVGPNLNRGLGPNLKNQYAKFLLNIIVVEEMHWSDGPLTKSFKVIVPRKSILPELILDPSLICLQIAYWQIVDLLPTVGQQSADSQSTVSRQSVNKLAFMCTNSHHKGTQK